MKTLSCREAGCECDYIAKGETEEEVMRDAADHGIKEHGMKQEDMTQMKDMLRALIHYHSGSTDTTTAFEATCRIGIMTTTLQCKLTSIYLYDIIIISWIL